MSKKKKGEEMRTDLMLETRKSAATEDVWTLVWPCDLLVAGVVFWHAGWEEGSVGKDILKGLVS